MNETIPKFKGGEKEKILHKWIAPNKKTAPNQWQKVFQNFSIDKAIELDQEML